jgi:hypothetical protein
MKIVAGLLVILAISAHAEERARHMKVTETDLRREARQSVLGNIQGC